MATLLHLLHLADSAFPVGAHAHSFGLETLVQQAAVADEAALRAALAVHLDVTLARTDLVALRDAHRRAAVGDAHGLVELDTDLSALKGVQEWRTASLGMGRRLLAAARSFVPAEALSITAAWGERQSGPHHAVAYALVGQALGLAVEDLAHAYAFGVVAAQVSAAVRLIPLGQTAAQRVLHDLKDQMAAAVAVSATLTREEMGGSLPLWEIAGMQHKWSRERLFIS